MWNSKNSLSTAATFRRLMSSSSGAARNIPTRTLPLHQATSSSQDSCRCFSTAVKNNSIDDPFGSAVSPFRQRLRRPKWILLPPSHHQRRQFASSSDMKRARSTLKRLSKILKGLEPVEPILSNSQSRSPLHREDLQGRKELLEETRAFFEALRIGVDEGTLNPSGKHGKELSQIVDYVLHAYSQAYTDTPVLQECLQVMRVAERDWNLDIQHSGYDSVIAVAHREEKWKEAAALFLRRIDPEGGFSPIEVSVECPLGLYAIAKLASSNDLNAAEAVFDAVFQLSMVSPNDQDKCKCSHLWTVSVQSVRKWWL